MAKGINKVILIGHLGQDPEQRHLPGGGEVCNLSVATTEAWKDKQTGQKKENTEWHRVTMFNKLGEIGNKYLTKGHQVYIEGRLQTRKWQDKNGQDRYTTEIIANNLQMLGGGNRQDQAPQQYAQRNTRSSPANNSGAGPMDFDSDTRFKILNSES